MPIMLLSISTRAACVGIAEAVVGGQVVGHEHAAEGPDVLQVDVLPAVEAFHGVDLGGPPGPGDGPHDLLVPAVVVEVRELGPALAGVVEAVQAGAVGIVADGVAQEGGVPVPPDVGDALGRARFRLTASW